MSIGMPRAPAAVPERALRIVHVVRQFAPGVGGIEAVVESLADEQVRQGHHVRVVTLDRLFHAPDTRLPAHEDRHGVEVRRVPFVGSRRYPIAPGALKFIRDADIVHVHAIDFFFDFLAALKPMHRKPLVASTHGGFFHTDFAKTLKKIYFTTLTRASVACYDYVAASSVQDEAAFRRLSGTRVGLIENGVDIRKFAGLAATEPRTSILYFGRIAPNKNIAALMPFLKALRDREGDWTLTVAGSLQGVSFDELRGAARQAGVADAVTFVESPSNEELKRLISQNSVFASASTYEGFGIAPIEALSAGLLPVISDIPPHRRTIEAAGEGVLADFADPGAAAAAFLESWSGWTARGAAARGAARESVARYDWSAVALRFEQVYRHVLD